MKKATFILVFLVFSGYCAYAQWIEQATGFTTVSRAINSISIVSDQIVWASAYDGSGANFPCEDITLTTNGGTLWTPHTIPGATNLFIVNISAVDANTAWVCMQESWTAIAGKGIYKTSDGGVTWARQPTAGFNSTGSRPDLVYFWDQNNGCCVGEPVNYQFEIYTTSNGGATWIQVPGADIPTASNGEHSCPGFFSTYGNIIWFGTYAGRVFKSTDFGHHWTAGVIPGWGIKPTLPVFRDAMNGLAQDRSWNTPGRMARTTDGGATWTPYTTTGNVFLTDIAPVPGTTSTWITTGSASGAAGVTCSFDDGTTWFDMPGTIGTLFLATRWVNNTTGWAGSYNVSPTVGGIFKFVSALEAPVADFAASPLAVATGGQVQFSDLSSGGITSWQWSFPGGSPASSNLQNPPQIIYNVKGRYDVSLTVTNVWGSAATTKVSYITVGNVGVADQEQVSVQVYPNPAKDRIRVKSNIPVQEAALIDRTGQVILRTNPGSCEFYLRLDNIHAGMYMLQLLNASAVSCQKIVVTR